MKKQKFTQYLWFPLTCLIIITLLSSAQAKDTEVDEVVGGETNSIVRIYTPTPPSSTDPCLLESVVCEDELKPTIEQVKEEIKIQSKQFGVNTQYALAIAQCESRFDYKAKNPNSTATGVYQFIFSTWKSTNSGNKLVSVYNYRANIKEAIILMSKGRAKYEWRDCYIKIGLTD